MLNLCLEHTLKLARAWIGRQPKVRGNTLLPLTTGASPFEPFPYTLLPTTFEEQLSYGAGNGYIR